MDDRDLKILYFLTSAQSSSIILLNIFGVIIIVGQKFISITSNENQTRKRQKITLNQQLIIALYLSHIGLGTTRLVIKTLLQYAPACETFIMIFRIAQFTISSLEIGFTVTISIERFVTVRYPLNFEKNKKVYRRCYLIIPLILSLTTSMTVLVLPRNIIWIMAWILSLLGAVAIFTSNTLLYRIVQQHNKDIATITVQNPVAMQKEDLRRKKRQMRSFNICVLITTSYVSLWIPYLTFSMFRVGRAIQLWAILDFLAYLNPLLDVLIYLAWTKNTRKVVKHILCQVFYCG